MRRKSTGSPPAPTSGNSAIIGCVRVLGIDVGGTFTDAVFFRDGEIRTAKVPTAAKAGGVGRRGGARGRRGRGRSVHARDDRRDERAARAQGRTHGVRDERGLRAPPAPAAPEPCLALSAVRAASRAARAARALRSACAGGWARTEELTPLELDSLPELDAEAVAICLLHAYRDASHERAVAAEVRRRLPDAHVVASHEIAPEFREYERASTTAIDAYLGPVVARYLRALAERCAAAGLPVPLVMRSSGGVAELEEAAAHPAVALVSGPAAGAVGAARVARAPGFENAIAFDMGGTSTDVCLIVGGEAARIAERDVGGFPVRLPIGRPAHGRRRRRLDRLARRRRRVARRPGKRGRGSRARRVTAAAARARRSPTPTFCSAACLRALPAESSSTRDAAERAFDGIDPEEAVAVVNAEMLRALRLVSVERGHDPRDFALVAFGGAGPLHACALAEELEMRTVLVPDGAGVLSALGLVASDERRDRVRSYIVPLRDAGELPQDGEADLRYAGQSFELTVPLQRGPRRGVPSRARGASTDTRTASARSSSSRCAPPTFGRRRRSSCRRAIRSTSPAPRVLELDGSTCWLPPGWVGAGMVPRWCSRDCEDRAPNHRQRPAGDRRGDGRRPDPLRVLREHQGAARLLHRALRRARTDDRPGRAHPRPPRRDARRGRGRDAQRPRARRRLHPQRPVHGRDAPARHHARLAHGARLRRVTRAPRRRRRRRAGQHARDVAHARRGRRRDPADAARRRDARSARRADAQPGGAPRRPARAARGAPPRRRAASTTSAHATGASASRRRWTSCTTTPSGSSAPASQRCPTARYEAERLPRRRHERSPSACDIAGDSIELDFAGHRPAAGRATSTARSR